MPPQVGENSAAQPPGNPLSAGPEMIIYGPIISRMIIHISVFPVSSLCIPLFPLTRVFAFGFQQFTILYSPTPIPSTGWKMLPIHAWETLLSLSLFVLPASGILDVEASHQKLDSVCKPKYKEFSETQKLTNDRNQMLGG